MKVTKPSALATLELATLRTNNAESLVGITLEFSRYSYLYEGIYIKNLTSKQTEMHQVCPKVRILECLSFTQVNNDGVSWTTERLVLVKTDHATSHKHILTGYFA